MAGEIRKMLPRLISRLQRVGSAAERCSCEFGSAVASRVQLGSQREEGQPDLLSFTLVKAAQEGWVISGGLGDCSLSRELLGFGSTGHHKETRAAKA
jgi:hypothetical protein